MLPSYLLSLREGIEAALIIGIVLGALGKIRRSDLKPAVWWGTLSAVLVSLVGAVLLTRFGLEMEGAAEKIRSPRPPRSRSRSPTWRPLPARPSRR